MGCGSSLDHPVSDERATAYREKAGSPICCDRREGDHQNCPHCCSAAGETYSDPTESDGDITEESPFKLKLKKKFLVAKALLANDITTDATIPEEDPNGIELEPHQIDEMNMYVDDTIKAHMREELADAIDAVEVALSEVQSFGMASIPQLNLPQLPQQGGSMRRKVSTSADPCPPLPNLRSVSSFPQFSGVGNDSAAGTTTSVDGSQMTTAVPPVHALQVGGGGGASSSTSVATTPAALLAQADPPSSPQQQQDGGGSDKAPVGFKCANSHYSTTSISQDAPKSLFRFTALENHNDSGTAMATMRFVLDLEAIREAMFSRNLRFAPIGLFDGKHDQQLQELCDAPPYIPKNPENVSGVRSPNLSGSSMASFSPNGPQSPIIGVLPGQQGGGSLFCINSPDEVTPPQCVMDASNMTTNTSASVAVFTPTMSPGIPSEFATPNQSISSMSQTPPVPIPPPEVPFGEMTLAISRRQWAQMIANYRHTAKKLRGTSEDPLHFIFTMQFLLSTTGRLRARQDRLYTEGVAKYGKNVGMGIADDWM